MILLAGWLLLLVFAVVGAVREALAGDGWRVTAFVLVALIVFALRRELTEETYNGKGK